jgi:hypothetical protein
LKEPPKLAALQQWDLKRLNLKIILWLIKSCFDYANCVSPVHVWDDVAKFPGEAFQLSPSRLLGSLGSFDDHSTLADLSILISQVPIFGTFR